jgi:predicted nucleic acid-binding protein
VTTSEPVAGGVYLLDTCIVSAYFRRDPKVVGRMEALPADAHVLVSAIVLGEQEYGGKLRAPSAIPLPRIDEIRKVSPKILDVTRHVAPYYGRLRALLFRRFSPRNKRDLPMAKWPEDLRDLATARELGIQENDLWLAAQAMAYSCVLVTGDRMKHIRDVVAPDELTVENWTA